MFNQRENREQMKIDRTAALLDNARQMAAQAGADRTAALTGMIGGVTSALGGLNLGGGNKKSVVPDLTETQVDLGFDLP